MAIDFSEHWVELYARGFPSFPENESKSMRIAAIASSSISIFCGLVGLYMFGAIHPKKRVFRHHLILFLILYDFVKAIILLIYPATVMSRPDVYDSREFCSTVGFFSAFAIEGADLAILTFAIHIFILIFWPNMKVNTGLSVEGGLFRVRYYVYAISVLLPALLAALAFINKDQPYQPETTWCYLPSKPVAYQLALSWVPRWCIMVLIFIIYVSVYWHVMHEYSKVSASMADLSQRDILKEMWKESFLYKVGKISMMLVFPDIQINAKLYGRGLDSDLDRENLDRLRNMRVDDIENNLEAWNLARDRINSDPLNAIASPRHELERLYQSAPRNATSLPAPTGLDIQRDLHKETMDMFQIRKLQIMKQMKAVFIYPLAYILLWLFPFINEGVRLHRGATRETMPWLAGLAAFFQAFNCTVDTTVFLVRETPWKLTCYEIDRTSLTTWRHARWRYWVSWLPLYHMYESDTAATNEKGTSSVSDEVPDFVNFRFDQNRNERQLSVVDPMEDDAEEEGDFSLEDALRMGPPKPQVPQFIVTESLTSQPQRRRSSKFSWLSTSWRGSLSGSSRKKSSSSASEVSPQVSIAPSRSPNQSRLADIEEARMSRNQLSEEMDITDFLKKPPTM